MDPFSPEADELLARHEAEALAVAKIQAGRRAVAARQQSARRMESILQQLAQAIYDFERFDSDIVERYDVLSEAMRQDELSPAQRRDLWAWVARVDEQHGWDA
jgi:thioesterase domain-containing protein